MRQAFPLGNGRYPASQWNAGEQIIDLDRVRIPPGLPSGLYRWRVSIGSGEPIELGDLRVSAPDRSFEVPPIAHPVNQTLGERVTLLGLRMQDAGCRMRNAA